MSQPGSARPRNPDDSSPVTWPLRRTDYQLSPDDQLHGQRRAQGQDPADRPGGPGLRGRGVTACLPARPVWRLLRRPTVRVLAGVVLVFSCWVCWSVGQALAADNGLSLAGKLAEWGRDHYLGPAITALEQITYSPPKTAKPQFSLACRKAHSSTSTCTGSRPTSRST